MKKHGKNSLSTYLDKYCPNEQYEEKWIYIDGNKSIYKIRDNGEVISTEYQGHKRKIPHVMQGGIDNDGYRIVTLTHNGIKKTYKIHRLVAEYFISNPFNKPMVNHIDGNKINNNYTNLEWVTNWENVIHAKDNGLRQSTNDTEYVKLVCKMLESNNYSIIEITDITGVNKETIKKIRNKINWKNISDNFNIENYNPKDHKMSQKQNPNLTDKQVEMICDELVKNELTIPEISTKLGIPTHVIRRIRNHKCYLYISDNYDFKHYNRVQINQFKRL